MVVFVVSSSGSGGMAVGGSVLRTKSEMYVMFIKLDL